jgi:hypothetical protein
MMGRTAAGQADSQKSGRLARRALFSLYTRPRTSGRFPQTGPSGCSWSRAGWPEAIPGGTRSALPAIDAVGTLGRVERHPGAERCNSRLRGRPVPQRGLPPAAEARGPLRRHLPGPLPHRRRPVDGRTVGGRAGASSAVVDSHALPADRREGHDEHDGRRPRRHGRPRPRRLLPTWPSMSTWATHFRWLLFAFLALSVAATHSGAPPCAPWPLYRDRGSTGYVHRAPHDARRRPSSAMISQRPSTRQAQVSCS